MSAASESLRNFGSGLAAGLWQALGLVVILLLIMLSAAAAVVLVVTFGAVLIVGICVGVAVLLVAMLVAVVRR